MKAYWPAHSVETHIMSKDPLNLINDNILNFSDIIYFHNEIENKNEVVNRIKSKKIPGIVLPQYMIIRY